MATYRQKIINRLESLKGIDGVTVQATNGKKGITVACTREKALDFKFQWADDHFIGYFVDAVGSTSQAVLSLWGPDGRRSLRHIVFSASPTAGDSLSARRY
ncbi:MAG: hypothetical protein HYY11_05305 [Candidatus Methylomirabilis oxyfera]|nr:hypothetical protein [Candidatus Methylomirabilis oxyfera]